MSATESPDSVEQVLSELKLWMQRGLEATHARRNGTGYGQKKGDGYTVVEIPEWDMRQKLEMVEWAIKNVNISPSCPRCDEQDEARAQAEDGMRNAAEIAGLQ